MCRLGEMPIEAGVPGHLDVCGPGIPRYRDKEHVGTELLCPYVLRDTIARDIGKANVDDGGSRAPLCELRNSGLPVMANEDFMTFQPENHCKGLGGVPSIFANENSVMLTVAKAESRVHSRLRRPIFGCFTALN